MGKVITVWGSPGSGKSMFCCILAKALTRDKRKAIIINADMNVPMLPVWLPEQIIQTNTSIGQVLSSVEIDTSLVASHVTVLKNYPFIGMMGYAAGENPLSYPEVKYTMVLQLIHAAAKLVDFVILDCSTSMTNVFTPAAIEAGDVVIRILTPDLKGINYLKAHQPLLVDERFRFSEHMTFAGLARPFHALDEMGYIIGGFDGLLPYSKEIIIVTQSLDEEKWVNRVTRTDFNVYNSAAFNVMESVQHHEDTLSQQAVDLIAGQPGVEDERYLYRNTKDDRNVLVDYGFEDLSGIELFHEEEGVVNQSYQGYSLYTSSDTERRYFGNVMGASENFWADMCIFEGEKDAETLTQKMATGEYVIIGCPMDKLTEEPRNTPLTDQLQVGESISFYKDGELVKTSTILAKAILVGTETETPTGTTAQAHIAADAPFVYLPDTVFKEIYDAPTLLTYGFNVDEALQPQMEEFLSSYVSENTSVAYTSTKLLKEQLDSVRSMILVIGGLIGCIMAFAGLINFTNMIITNIITRRHEFATMQSIGMTGKQLRCLTVYEGIYYAVGADIIGGAVAAILAVTVLKSALNGPSMWFFTLNITLVPVLVIGVLYLLLAAVIPLIVLHFFNKGTVVERLRTSE